MVVIVGKRTYKVGKQIVKKMLEIASDNVPFGIYAIEKNGIIEMRKDDCKSAIQLKKLTHKLKKNGYKVYSNR